MNSQEAIIDEMLQPLTDALTPETAKMLANLKATPSAQARIDELAAKCIEGKLSKKERADYEMYVRMGNLLNLLKAKAKQIIANSPHG